MKDPNSEHLSQLTKPLTVTVPTALAITGIGRTKFYELVNEGKIRTVALGRRRLVVYASLEELTR